MSMPRVRRHTDGRVAMRLPDVDIRASFYYTWSCWALDSVTARHMLLSDSDVAGNGWTELFVAELPDPDGHSDTSHDTTVAQWDVSCLREVNGTVTAWGHGIEVEGLFYDAEDGEIEHLEQDALKLIAAISTHRQYAATNSHEMKDTP